MLVIWSLVPLPFQNPGWTSGSFQFTYCWSLTWRILSIYFTSMWNECSLCGSLNTHWHCLCLALPFFGTGMKSDLFQSCDHCWIFQIFWHIECKEIQLVHPKGDQSWVFIGRTDVEAEAPILWPPDVKSWLVWKDPDGWERWRAGGEWDGWMASPAQRTWVWVNSGSWWWTGRPGVLRSMESQRVGYDRVTELNWTE